MSYDTTTTKFSIYSEDFALAGKWPFTLRAIFSEYDQVVSDEASAQIEIWEGCKNNTITAPNIDMLTYTITDHKLDY